MRLVDSTSATPTCVVCSEHLTEGNDSREHVIPNAIGGRIKVRGFICAACNNKAGHEWDSELAKQMHSLCLFFGIVRDRGEPPSLPIVTTAGERLNLMPGGGFALTEPQFTTTKTDSGTQVSFSARDLYEARRMLTGLKRKYPSIDVESMLARATEITSYPEGLVKLEFSFGGVLGGRSIVKTAAAFAHYCGITHDNCKLATEYLRIADALPCFGFYYDGDVIQNRTAGLPFHCVAISTDPITGLALAYVEYFGAIRVVVCLSESYRGPAIRKCHAINPLTGDDLAIEANLSFTKEDISAIYAYEKCPNDLYQQAFAGVIPTGLQRQRKRELDRAVGEAVRYAFANCGAKEGEALTGDETEKLYRLFQEKIQPYMQRQISTRRIEKNKIRL